MGQSSLMAVLTVSVHSIFTEVGEAALVKGLVKLLFSNSLK